MVWKREEEEEEELAVVEEKKKYKYRVASLYCYATKMHIEAFRYILILYKQSGERQREK